MLEQRDSILEGVLPFDLDHLKAVAEGSVGSERDDDLARLEAKGWLERHGEVHLITLTGRALLERPPIRISSKSASVKSRLHPR